jgi:hypothetical protein
MNIEVGDLLTLDDNKDYIVVAISNKNDSTYYCLGCVNDINFTVFKLNLIDDSLELMDKDTLSKSLISDFTNSYKDYLHGLYYDLGVNNG